LDAGEPPIDLLTNWTANNVNTPMIMAHCVILVGLEEQRLVLGNLTHLIRNLKNADVDRTPPIQ